MFTQRLIPTLHRTLKYNIGLTKCIQSTFMSTETKSSKLSFFTNSKLALIGLGFTGVAVGTYVSESNKKTNVAVANPSDTLIDHYLLKEKPPHYTPARSIQSTSDKTGLKLTLYQYQTCPFCCKVRAFLDYYGFSYDVIEVNSVTRRQTKWTDYRKVPFLVVEPAEGNHVYQLKDSSAIISALYSLLINRNLSFNDVVNAYPMTNYIDQADGKLKTEITNKYFLMYGDMNCGRSKEELENERKWRKWVDDEFVHTLSPNIYRTPTEAYRSFSWFSEVGEWDKHFAAWERLLVVYVGSAAMYFIGGMLKRRHSLKDDVRESLYDEANNWVNNIKKDKDFMGGVEPDLTDLNVYGILTAIEGCDSFEDLIANTKIHNWFYKMKAKVHENNGSDVLASRGIVV